jgi:PAS domain S-box-containing protein
VIDLTALSFAPEDSDAFFLRHPSASLLYDPATRRIVAANHAAEALYGWTSAELCAMSLHDMRPPSESGQLDAELDRLAQDDGTRWFDGVHRRKDGQAIHVLVLSQPMRLAGRLIRRTVILDVTANVRAEALFRGVAEQSLTGIYVIQDGRFVYLNPRLAEMFGYTVEHLLAHPDPLALLSTEARAEAARHSELRLAGTGAPVRYLLRARRRDGAPVAVEIYGSSLTLNGRPALLGTVLDVTERDAFDAALRDSEAQLRHAQKMEAVGRLAGGVAHDFNNLLTVIGSNADLGLELARDGFATVEEFQEIRAAVERAAALTRQLLAFSRRQVLAPGAVSINDVVLDAERMLRRVIGEDVVLETQLDELAGEVVADRGQLEQVLMNLVVNSRDAMPDGGLVVISTQRDREGKVALAVSDTGAGMVSATMARAFEPFFTTKELGKGTGLGLSTVYGIAQQSGGDVSIRSAPGAGTTVTVTLPHCGGPADSSAHSERGPAGAAGQGPGGGETILLVEDEPPVRAAARRILVRRGYEVIEAANGADALFLWSLHRARIRLVLTDVVMPLMGGRELAERLHEVGAGIPVLYMSGYADGDRGGELPAGAELLGKPFSAEALGARVAHLLSRAPH